MSTADLLNVWESHPSLSASMEDFESHALTPQLSRTQSHLQFRSPVVSQYSDVTDDTQDSGSPPAWRKAGTGWFKHQQGLASPMRSREGSPLKDHEEHDNIDSVADAAAEIPLPGSPLKGRSLSRSTSPMRQPMPTPEAEVRRSKYSPNMARRQSSEPRAKSQNNCRWLQNVLLERY